MDEVRLLILVRVCFLFGKVSWYNIKVKVVLHVLYFGLFVNVFIFKGERKNNEEKKVS